MCTFYFTSKTKKNSWWVLPSSCHIPFLVSLLSLMSLQALAGVPLTVEVSGLKDPLRTNVINFLDIEKNKNNEELSIRWIKRLHEQAPQEIREALYPYGYYQAKIQAELTEVEGKWLARYTIDAGVAVRITERNIQWTGEGAALPVFAQSIQDYIAKADDKMVHSEYEAAKSKFLNIALSEGYPQAKINNSEIIVDLENNTAALTLFMDTGPLFYFGEITFKQDFLNPDLLQKYITLEKGQPYSHKKLLEFQQNLIASNYAREVTINPLFTQAQEKQLAIEVLMKPVAPHKLSFGLGYETGTGIRGSARWEDRLLNRYGHYSDLNLKTSQKEGSLQGQYSIPVHHALTDSWVSTASAEHEETPDTNSNTAELETAFVRRNLEDTLFYKGFVLASYEQFTIGDEPQIGTKIFSLGGTIHYSDIEDSMYPQRGYFFFSDLRGAAEALLSDTGYTRLHIKGRYLFGLGENGRLDTHLEFGTTWVDDYSIYPASLRFFAGGDTSVRGYSYESLSHTDKDGTAIGGKNIFTASLEYDHRVAESWVFDVFADAGNAYNDTVDKVYIGSGFGFRWLAPFGSLRIDLAWPVSEGPALDDARIHVGFGATL